MVSVSMTVNGRSVTEDVEPRMLLVAFLRERAVVSARAARAARRAEELRGGDSPSRSDELTYLLPRIGHL